ncbi:hypothetical protein IWX50DRAFT_668141 [Phyllosticta citricarpa]
MPLARPPVTSMMAGRRLCTVPAHAPAGGLSGSAAAVQGVRACVSACVRVHGVGGVDGWARTRPCILLEGLAGWLGNDWIGLIRATGQPSR